MFNKIHGLIKHMGLLASLKFIFVRGSSKLIALPIALSILFLSPFIRIRFVKLFSSRIGHYSFNTEAILCGLDLNLDKDKNTHTFFYVPPGQPICNTQLHLMWQRTLSFIPFSSIAMETDKFLQKFESNASNFHVLKTTFEPGGDGRDRWGLLRQVNKCHLTFTSDEDKIAQQLLMQLGIPAGAKYVCLLVRDSQYLKTFLPSGDWSYHDYRDADINSYHMAAEYLANKGYYVIRMGKAVKDPFKSNHPNIIDYALSPLRSDFLDMYLSANCFFFISTCTGLDSVARVFRKPFLVTNLGLPDFDIWHPWDLFIPKKVMDMNKNELLTFKEMNTLYQSLGHKKTILQQLQQQNLRFIDNTPEEIYLVVKEMVKRLENKWRSTKEEENLQQEFWQIFPKYVVSEKLPNLSIPVNENINMRIGNDFLKQHHFLFKKTPSWSV